MSWKLSVSEYVPPFDSPQDRYMSFNANTATSVSTIDSSEEVDKYYVRPNDILKLGPSTDSANEGSSEFVRVTQSALGANKSTFTTTPATTYAYLLGDPITCTASGIPSGWTYNWNAADDGTIEFQGHKPMENSSLRAMNMWHDDSTGLYLAKAAGTVGWTYLEYFLNRKLIADAVYRLGIYQQLPSVGAGTMKYRLYDGTAAIIDIDISGQNSLLAKEEDTGTWGILYTDTVNTIDIAFYFDVNFDTMFLSTPYLTHAQLTAGYASGYYTIPYDPISFDKIHTGKGTLKDSVSNTPITTESNNTYRIIWNDADQEMLRNLEVFQWWQDQGNELMLETDLTNYTAPIFGTMDYSLSYNHWDLNKVTVNMVFRGR